MPALDENTSFADKSVSKKIGDDMKRKKKKKTTTIVAVASPYLWLL